MHNTRAFNRRLNTLALGISCVFSIIAGRLFYLQINLSTYFINRGTQNFLRRESIPSLRGNIIDSTGALLATNRPVTQLYWQGSGQKTLTSTQRAILEKIGAVLSIPLGDDLYTKITSVEKQYRQLLLASDVPLEKLSQIEELYPNNPNILITNNFQRHYPYGMSGCHILGALGKEINYAWQGTMGLEKLLNDNLKGQDGIIEKTINSLGRNITQTAIQKELDGHDIQITIDIQLQKLCEQCFPAGYAGTMILMDPNTGALKSLVSFPQFDPTIFLSTIDPTAWKSLQEERPFLNRAFNACYPPGSISKLVSVSAALEKGLIAPDTLLHCKGYVYFGKRKIRCHKQYGGHGQISTLQAVAQSCNTLFYEIGKHIDIDVLTEYAYKFGLGQATTILFAERTGLVPSREWKRQTYGEPWWPGETLSVAIGQSFLLATPIQVARMISSIFSGYLVKPRILLSEEIEKKPLKIKPETIQFLKKSMRSVVKKGTGKRISTIKDIIIYAKTSTAQTSDLSKRQLGKEYLEHGWFVGYFKYKEENPLTIVILVEHAGSAQVATTAAKNFLISYKKDIDKKMQS